jgi:ABC-type nickel/cobalt efflux system permease component RcnA
MGVGVSIFLLGAGAVLAFAVDVDTQGFDVNTVGIILMIVGGLGLLFSMMFWESWGGYGWRRQTTVMSDHTHGHSHEPTHVHAESTTHDHVHDEPRL